MKPETGTSTTWGTGDAQTLLALYQKQKHVVSRIQARLTADCEIGERGTVRGSGEVKDMAVALGVAVDKLSVLIAEVRALDE